jgi:hypothetical protein
MRRSYMPLLACAAALALIAPAAEAQVIGFKVGANWSNLSGDDVSNTSAAAAFVGGGHIRLGFGGRIGVQGEILSITRATDFSTNTGQTVGDLRLEYVDIPVLIHVPLTMGMGLAPYAFAGPFVSLEVKCRITPTGGSAADCDNQSGLAGNRNSTLFGATAGGGLAFGLGPGALIVEGRYNFGMSNINSGTGTSDVRHRGPAVMAGYELSLVGPRF